MSTVIGCEPYRFIAGEFGRPVVVSGFEPVDIMQSIAMIVRQLNAGEARVENQYGRAVAWVPMSRGSRSRRATHV